MDPEKSLVSSSIKALETLLRNLQDESVSVQDVYDSYLEWDSLSSDLGTLLQSLVLEGQAMTPELFSEWYTSDESLAKRLYPNYEELAKHRGFDERAYRNMVLDGDHYNAIFYGGDTFIKRVHDMASQHARKGDPENKLGLYNAILKYLVDVYNSRESSPRRLLTLVYPEIDSRYDGRTMRTDQPIISGNVGEVFVPGIPGMELKAAVFVKP